jgi:hypothetical protein
LKNQYINIWLDPRWNDVGTAKIQLDLKRCWIVSSREPHLITQPELNDLVQDLKLCKEQVQLLGSRLQEWKLLHKN